MNEQNTENCAGNRVGQTHFLSQTERELGFKYYGRHSFWNGLGISFLAPSVVNLLALNFGAGNVEVGYITSAFHFAGLLLLFVPQLLQGKRMSDIFFGAWFARGVVCYLYVIVLFMDDRPAVILIMAIYTLFACFRIVAIPVTAPIQRSLVRPSEEGGMVVRLHTRMSISQLISQVISFLLLSIAMFNGSLGLVILIMIGATANTVASLVIRKIPSRELVEVRKGRNVFKLLTETLRHSVRGRVMVIQWMSLITTILFGFGVAFLRNSVGMPSNMVFLYTIAVAVAAIAASNFLRPFADTIGSKPLLIIANAILLVAALAWAIVAPTAPWVVYYGMAFGTFFFQRIRMMLISRLIVKTLPERDKISYTSMLNFAAGIVAFLVGMIGGVIADFSVAAVAQNTPVLGITHLPHAYSITYLVAAVFCGIGMILTLRLKDSGSLTLRETAAVFLSTKNMRAFIDINQLGMSDDPQKRETTLLSLEQNYTPVATTELRNRLRTPLTWERERILRSLFAYPREEALDDIISEARDPHSYNRVDAIFTLGAYPQERSRQALLEFTREPDPTIVATALKSLGRIGVDDMTDTIVTMLQDPGLPPRAELDLIRALTLMDVTGSYLRRMFTLAHPSRGRRFEQMAFITMTLELDLDPLLSPYYASENVEPGRGFRELLDDGREVHDLWIAHREMVTRFGQGEFDWIWNWCVTMASDPSGTAMPPSDGSGTGRTVNDPFRSIRKAFLTGKPVILDRHNCLAAVYFSYHLLKREIS
jgi:hypothetical protein